MSSSSITSSGRHPTDLNHFKGFFAEYAVFPVRVVDGRAPTEEYDATQRMRYNGWSGGFGQHAVVIHDPELRQLLTRARNSLGSDVLYDAFIHALEVHATRFTPSSTFGAVGADVGSGEIPERHTDRRAAMEAIKTELRRLLTKH
jgi:hypothetical protein